MNKSLGTVVVDMTPVLPGGENGGAKIFVLELLRRLAALNSKTSFVLLTQSSSHAEMKTLECANVRCMMILGIDTNASLRMLLLKRLSRLLAYMPGQLKVFSSKIGYRLHSAFKRRGSQELLQEIGADLLFCPFTAPIYHVPGIPTVCTIYDLQYKTYPEFFSNKDVEYRNHTFMDACKYATGLAAISDYSRETAIQYASLDLNRIRTIHLRMAQRISLMASEDDDILNHLGLVTGRYLLYPANFWRHKNHEMLLTAFSMACHDGLVSDLKLVCTGAPGERQQWLKKSVHMMNLAERVIFPGYISNTQLAVLMNNCHGIVFPSLYEGFGLPIVEAMSAGVPVACSNTTSLPEVAGRAAIFFDPGIPAQIARAIKKLVEDKGVCKEIVQAGFKRAEIFSDSERMAKEYWELFNFALANKKQEDEIIGVYPDKWVGSQFNIQLAPSKKSRKLELEFHAPNWLPSSTIEVDATQDGKSLGTVLKIKRDSVATISLPCIASFTAFSFKISPIFIPAECEMGEDVRELSLVLQQCAIDSQDEKMDLLKEVADL